MQVYCSIPHSVAKSECRLVQDDVHVECCKETLFRMQEKMAELVCDLCENYCAFSI